MRHASRLVFSAVLLTWPGLAAAGDAEPANPAASPRARAVLRYLQGLEGRSDRKIVSGQFTNFGPSATATDCERAFKQTGRWPAMIGLDYADFGTGGLAYERVNKVAIDYARKGGLVTISAHLYSPARSGGHGLRDKDVDLKSLLEPGTETHGRWMKELDILAAGLGQLQDAGVVVQWRPFHEMNGDWFWWGGKDPGTFIRVWQHMFEYFTNTKKLNNLLWVYSPNHGRRTAAYYAGDRYVDVVGLDAYTDLVDPKHILGAAEVAGLPKPFGFTEFGPHGPHNPPGDYDYRRFLEGVQAHFPRTCFFLSWHDNWGLGRNRYTRELLNHPAIVNREDLPRELAASTTPP
ncbi:MAG: glycosyl hydrolase [Isosphaeraceae bacterium]